ncbi:uncharacterized protein A1O9_00363 [Exophiala aquamarina CBS 119918]|uniref:Uncharacterized protein n=1 Tax=Exophiala aquamarina CBS 119918 TaxID=1182545 RepID=A0A072PR98_9EURO|nr:uncharacterized protein A1O9_00363 [Exophiala aquamarina CBS 119918]KEF62391.1 hypothetical protein A1O9_00363 [Exophiala aquamarina CBS 119918]
MAEVKRHDIETVILDVQSEESLQSAVLEVSSLTGGSLDILINNAGSGYSIPLSDALISKSKDIFDLNVWGLLCTTQSFLPLLLKSKSGGMVVNNTGIDSVVSAPFQGVYNASKAAAAMISANLRLELAPFGIKVIDLKTGGVKSNFWVNAGKINSQLPPNSLYTVARDGIENAMKGGPYEPKSVDRHVWAKATVKDLSKANPRLMIWRGDSAFIIWIGTFLPLNAFDSILKKMTGISDLEGEIRSQGKEKVVNDSGFIAKTLRR